MYLLIGIGTLDDLILQCMNEAGVDGWFAGKTMAKFAMDMAKFAMAMAKFAMGMAKTMVVVAAVVLDGGGDGGKGGGWWWWWWWGGWVIGWVVATGGLRGLGAPVGVKVSASSRDPATASSRDPATVKGVRHKKCPAKMLRERLHNRRNHLRKMERPRFSTSQKRRTQPAGRRENRSRVPSARASVAWRKI